MLERPTTTFKPNRQGKDTAFIFAKLNITPLKFKLMKAGEHYQNRDDTPTVNFNTIESNIITAINSLISAGKKDIISDFSTRLNLLTKELRQYETQNSTAVADYHRLMTELSSHPESTHSILDKIDIQKKKSDELQTTLHSLETRFSLLEKEVLAAKSKLVPATQGLRPD